MKPQSTPQRETKRPAENQASSPRQEAPSAAPDDWTAEIPPLGELARPSGPEVEPENGGPPAPPAQDVRDADALLQRLSETIRTAKPMLHALLTHRLGAKLEGDRLILSFAPTQRVLVDQLSSNETKSQVEDAAAELLGRRVHIVVSIDESTPASGGVDDGNESRPDRPSGKGAPETERDALRERARQDPLVRRFVETFQGEVEEIRGVSENTSP